MKKIFAIFTALSLLASVCLTGTALPVSAADTYITSPSAGTNVTGITMAVNIAMPQNALESTLYFDGGSVSTFTRPLSGVNTVNVNLSNTAYGVHILECRMQYTDYADFQESSFIYSGSGSPVVNSVTYEQGGDSISVAGSTSVNPYTKKISLTFAAIDISSFSADNVKLYSIAYGKRVKLSLTSSLSGNTISIIPETHLSSGEMHVIVISGITSGGVTPSKNSEIFFNVSNMTPKTTATVYKFYDFESTADLSISNQGGSIGYEKQNGNGLMHFNVASGTVSKSYADMTASDVNTSSTYVVDVMVKPVSVGGSSFIELFDAKTSAGYWRLGATFDASGNIKMNGTTVSTWTAGNWYRYSAAYNTTTGICKIYINGTRVRSIYVGTVKPTIFRIDLNSSNGDGNLDFYIDDLALYALSEPLSDMSALYPADTIMDTEVSAQMYIGEAAAFSVSGNYYYADKKRGKYSGIVEKPILHDDSVWIPCAFIKNILGYNITESAGTVTVGDIAAYSPSITYTAGGYTYIKASDIANAAGKTITYDKRGYFVFSDGAFSYTDAENFIEMFEPADVIYRYLQFSNPRGEEMLSDFNSHAYANQHPRILCTADDIAYIKAKAATDVTYQSAVEAAENEAAYMVSAGTYDSTFTADCADSDKQTQAVTFQSVIERLAIGYLLSGSTAFADKAISYMKILCQWSDLGYSTANLTTGHWAMGMAVGYDTFYDYMNSTDDGKASLATIKSAVVNRAFNDTVTYYKTEGTFAQPHWMKIRDNFSGVIGGGMTALALAFADSADLYDDEVYMLENLVKTHEIAVSLYASNGGYFEGLGYSEYMLTNLTHAFEAMFNCCGGDYDLGSAQGFSDAGSFFVYLQGSKNTLNFHDSTADVFYTPLPYWFAMRYGKTEYAQLMKEQADLHNKSQSVLGLLYYGKAVDTYGTYDTSSSPPDRYFGISEAGSFRNSFHTTTPTFTGFHGGRTGLTHDMLDLGEFVFESDGAPWAIDLGADSYSLPNYFGTDGYKLYRKRPEGENCVVINPTVDPETYFGQTIGANAKLDFCESSNKAAMASYDLTSAYTRDASSYKRGYYLGDDRNTLTVRDEITLRGTSEVYWFMHTKASLEIVSNNEAVLTYGGKKLRAEVYCSDSSFTLSSMAASPLASSPVVSGQNSNEGITKLAIHTTASTGSLVFAVKLIPESEYFDAAELKDSSIASWTLPQGDIVYKTVVSDAYVDYTGSLSACVQIPSGTSKVRFLLDGEEIVSETPSQTGKFTKQFASSVSAGEHELLLEAQTANGTERSVTRFINKGINAANIYSNTMSDYGGMRMTTNYTGWVFEKYGNGTSNGDSYSLNSADGSAVATAVRTYNMTNKITSGTFVCDCDVKFSSLEGHFEFECRNASSDGWFLYSTKIFNNGLIADGENYATNIWYHVKLVVDLNTTLCTVYVNGTAVIGPTAETNASSITVCKVQYTPINTSDTITYKNMYFRRHTTYDTVYISTAQSGATASATLNVPTAGALDEKNVKLYICSYKDGKLTAVMDSDRVAGTNTTVGSADIQTGTDHIKAFAFDTDTLEPKCRASYMTILN